MCVPLGIIIYIICRLVILPRWDRLPRSSGSSPPLSIIIYIICRLVILPRWDGLPRSPSGQAPPSAIIFGGNRQFWREQAYAKIFIWLYGGISNNFVGHAKVKRTAGGGSIGFILFHCCNRIGFIPFFDCNKVALQISTRSLLLLDKVSYLWPPVPAAIPGRIGPRRCPWPYYLLWQLRRCPPPSLAVLPTVANPPMATMPAAVPSRITYCGDSACARCHPWHPWPYYILWQFRQCPPPSLAVLPTVAIPPVPAAVPDRITYYCGNSANARRRHDLWLSCKCRLCPVGWKWWHGRDIWRHRDMSAT